MLKAFGDIIENLDTKYSGKKRGHSSYSKESFDFLNLINSWNEIVGKKIAEKTIPLKINNRTLVILANHPVFAQQLSFLEKELLNKISITFPTLKTKLKSISFQVNPTFFKQKQDYKTHSLKKKEKMTIHKYSPQYQQAAREADKEFDMIDDEELKSRFKSIFIQNKLQ